MYVVRTITELDWEKSEYCTSSEDRQRLSILSLRSAPAHTQSDVKTLISMMLNFFEDFLRAHVVPAPVRVVAVAHPEERVASVA